MLLAEYKHQHNCLLTAGDREQEGSERGRVCVVSSEKCRSEDSGNTKEKQAKQTFHTEHSQEVLKELLKYEGTIWIVMTHGC